MSGQKSGATSRDLAARQRIYGFSVIPPDGEQDHGASAMACHVG